MCLCAVDAFMGVVTDVVVFLDCLRMCFDASD